MHAATAADAPRTRRDGLTALALAGLACAAFVPSLDCGFVNYDDPNYVTQNPHVRAGLTPEGTLWAFSFHESNWHPLTWLSLQLDASLGGADPRGFHRTNVLLHGANAALLFLALRALTGAFWRSAAVALLFAVHPLRVESVAWVSERKDVLSALFGLLALGAYAHYVHAPALGRYLAVLGLFALSLLAKPMLVTLPCLLLVLDWWPLRRIREPGSWRGLVGEKLPLLGLAVACCVVTFRAQAADGAVRDWQAFPLSVRLGNAAVGYVAYPGKTVWPLNLAVFYPHPGAALPAWRVAAAALLLVALTAGAVALRRRAPYLLAGWLWYVGTLVPVIGIVQVGGQAYADRYTYFPQVGLLIAVCWGAAELARGRAGDALAAGAVTAVALAALTWDQQSVWHDSAALWGHAFGVTGEDPVVLVNLGQALEESGRLEEAAIRLRSALLLDPGSFAGRINLGSTLLKQKKWDEAELQFREACSLRPGSPWGHNWLGKLYLERVRLAEAAEQFEEACRLAPGAGEGYTNLGMVQEKRGDFARAAESYREALRLEPNSAEAHYGLGSVLLARGDAEGGIARLHEALRLDPRLARAHTLLGKTLAARNDLRGASEHLERVAGLHPGSPSAWYNWGIVLGQQGRYADAARCLTRALELDPGSAAIRQARDRALEAAGRGRPAGPAPGTPPPRSR